MFVLCETNGGTLPFEIAEIVTDVRAMSHSAGYPLSQ
jgi:isopropylmalate/homocitrate/citramalate synthase